MRVTLTNNFTKDLDYTNQKSCTQKRSIQYERKLKLNTHLTIYFFKLAIILFRN